MYHQLLQQWASLAPNECSTTNRNYKFKVRILPAVEQCESVEAWRLITTENFAWRLANKQAFVLLQLNFVLLTVINHCSVRQSNISFTFGKQETTAFIGCGLRSQPQPHPVIAALDSYIQLLEITAKND